MSKGISQTVVRKPKYKEVSKAFDIAIERVMLVATQEVKNKAQLSIQWACHWVVANLPVCHHCHL